MIIKKISPEYWDTFKSRARLYGASIRLRGRGPRPSRRDHQSIPLDRSTHATAYIGKGGPYYAFAGRMKNGKPVLRPV